MMTKVADLYFGKVVSHSVSNNDGLSSAVVAGTHAVAVPVAVVLSVLLLAAAAAAVIYRREYYIQLI